MAQSAMEQMNTRIDAELRRKGNEVFACLGYTPSHAVRGLYEFAVRNGDNPHAIEKVIAGDRAADDEAALAECNLFCAALSLKDVFYIPNADIRHAVKEELGFVNTTDALAAREIAWGFLDNISTLATTVGLDESDVWLAKKYRSIHPDFEDILIMAAAKRCKADYLDTSDRRLIEHSLVAALSPEDMLALLQA